MKCEDCEKRTKPFYYCSKYKRQVGRPSDFLKIYGCNINGEIPE